MCTYSGKKKIYTIISYIPVLIQASIFAITYPGLLPLLIIDFVWGLVKKIPAYDSTWISYSLLAYRVVRLRQYDECILDECEVPEYATYVLLAASILTWIGPEVPVPKEKKTAAPAPKRVQLRMV